MAEGIRRNALLMVMLFFAGMAAYGQDLPIRVEINVAQLTVKNNQEFPVSTTIRNVGRAELSLQIGSCSYPRQWIADNPAIRVASGYCMKDSITRVTLRSGEAYQRVFSMYVGVAAEQRNQKSVTFRLGFEPADRGKGTSPIWSNPLTLNVIE